MTKKIIPQIQKHVDFEIRELTKLDGYENANYHIETNGKPYIFKTYPYSDETQTLVKAENNLLRFLKKNQENKFPVPVAFSDGSYLKVITVEGVKKIGRTLTFLTGDFLGDVHHSADLYRSLGRFLATLDITLRSFDSHIYKARKWPWDIQHLNLNRELISDIPDAHERNIVRYFFQQFQEHVVPALPALRTSVIHNDVNEWNLLTANGEISALIDFGDVTHSSLINELAVAITYACYDKEHPLDWAAIILKAYHEILPLEEQEIDLLYDLIAARLCMSVCQSAHAKKINPENEYATVSEKWAWNMLHHWLRINPTKARNVFRSAAGYPVCRPEHIESVVERRHNVLSPIFSLTYNRPIHMQRAAFQYMYDAEGNTFLDAYNNIPHVGHSHPHVVAAGQRQMAKLNTNTRYLYDILPEYAEKLLSKFPEALNKIYFVNSGSAASDLAMRIAFAHTRREKIMVMEHGYHGNTQMSMAISDYKFNNKKGRGQQDFILKTPIPNTYRGQYQKNDGRAGQKYARDAIKTIEQSAQPIAAFISEPIVGCGGQVPLANGYLKKLYPAIRNQGGVCISDEVQTGFGRLGDHFWGFKAQDVVPDIVIIGKPMGNGHPMAAVVTTDEIAHSFSKGVEFFSSFGGNPVSCAIGLSVLEIIAQEKLQKNAKKVGDYYSYHLRRLQEKYSCIGDVRGSGLFLGVEFVKDGTMQPDTKLAQNIKNNLRNRHILVSTDGPHNSVIKSKPPLCFTKENAKIVVEHIDTILENHYNNR